MRAILYHSNIVSVQWPDTRPPLTGIWSEAYSHGALFEGVSRPGEGQASYYVKPGHMHEFVLTSTGGSLGVSYLLQVPEAREDFRAWALERPHHLIRQFNLICQVS